MNVFLSRTIENIILVTGIINLVFVLLLFLTCRFIPRSALTKSWINQKWFKLLYRYHSYFWWVLIPSVLIHFVIVILHILAGG
jgi:hypothetical protein